MMESCKLSISCSPLDLCLEHFLCEKAVVLTRQELVNLQLSEFLHGLRQILVSLSQPLKLLKSFVNFTKVNPALDGAVLEKQNGQCCGTQVGELVALSSFNPSIRQ